MAKRLTDTEKWKKALIRGLPAAYKLLWFYICDDCNHAGIWDVDFEVAEVRVGEKLDPNKALNLLSTKVLVFDAGRKWFIPSFVSFQYKNIKAQDRATKSVVEILLKYNLIDSDYNIVTIEEDPNKGLTRPIDGCKDKVKDKVIVILNNKKELVFQNDAEEYRQIWQQWITYKKDEHKDKFKTVQSEQIALNNLYTLSDNLAPHAREIVNNSISNRYKGLFKPNKNASNSQSKRSDPLASFNRSIAEAKELYQAVADGQRSDRSLEDEIYGTPLL